MSSPSERRRIRVPLALVAAAILVVGGSQTPDRSPRSRPPGGERRVIAGRPAPESHAPAVPRKTLRHPTSATGASSEAPQEGPLRLDAAARRARSRARATVRVFLTAFLAAERGARRPAVVRGIRHTATPQLARALLAHPARRPPGQAWPPRARVRHVTLYGPSAGRLKALATLERAGRRGVLELRLLREHGRWRVAELG